MTNPNTALGISDAAFRNIQLNNSGFYIWRIEQLELVPVPRDSYGKFFSGDSYIVFACTEYGGTGGVDTRVRPISGGRMEQHIHFWLGQDSTQDEAAVAAYKTVELDDFLGGAPIQHREVQGHESKRFLSYFKHIRILQGGVSSGLNHVVDDETPKLYIVKGKRQPIVRQLPTISWEHLNEGDVFLLDTRHYIFVWVGRSSNRLERLQAAKLAQTLKDENGGEDTIVYLDDGAEGNLPEAELDVLNSFLPLAAKKVRAASEAESDEKEDVRTRKDIKLYRCSDEEGTLKITEVKTGPLLQSDLRQEDSFIIDNGNAGIWVWVGKKASGQERTEAMRNAQGFIRKKNYNPHTQVTRVVDNGEPAEFKSLFKGWKDKDQTVGMGRKATIGRGIAKVVQTKFDAKTLHERPGVAAESRMVDDGKGAKEVFRVDNFDLLQVPEEEYGKFFSGDCYVVLYAYNNGSRDQYIIYYWLGAHSSQDEQGTAALKAVELDDRLGGAPVQVRVVQGKEPPHFLAIFQGKLTIFEGGLSSAFDGDTQDTGPGSTYLLQVHGRTELATKAVQEKLEAASLNTNDCFVLVSPRETYIWLGKGSTGDEREMAKALAYKTDKDPTLVMEGQEKSDFWEALGGKGPYMDERVLKNIDDDFDARLFHGSNATGNFRLEEIMHFGQMDLVTEDVMLLDVGDSIFVWLGRDSNDQERRACFESAREYLECDPSGRDQDVAIIVVKQGYEPPLFTGFFGAWDEELFQDENGTHEENGLDGSLLEIVNSASSATNGRGGPGSGRYYSYEALTGDTIPNDVDPLHKEMHLNDGEFEGLFKMTKEAFEELPQWKQLNLKKAVNLF